MRHLLMTASLISLALAIPCSLAEEASELASLKSLMSTQQYQAMGLEKLNKKEQELLLQWIQNQDAGNVAVSSDNLKNNNSPGQADRPATVLESDQVGAESESNFGFPDKAKQSERLYANVKPPFRGWNGKTIFYLENGQVWKQRVAGRYTYSGDDMRVAISRNSWGFYELELLAADRSVGVTRVK